MLTRPFLQFLLNQAKHNTSCCVEAAAHGFVEHNQDVPGDIFVDTGRDDDSFANRLGIRVAVRDIAITASLIPYQFRRSENLPVA